MATTTDSEEEPTTMQVDGSERRLAREQPTVDDKLSALQVSATAFDRKKTCPMYIRLFCRLNGHHRPEEFAPLMGGGGVSLSSTPSAAILADEVTIYTWWDATLAELADLLREVNEECRGPAVHFSFALVWGDLRGCTQIKSLGIVGGTRAVVSEGRGRRISGERTLRDLRFRQGDFIDVAIYPYGKPSMSLPPATTDEYSARGGRPSERWGGRVDDDRRREESGRPVHADRHDLYHRRPHHSHYRRHPSHHDDRGHSHSYSRDHRPDTRPHSYHHGRQRRMNRSPSPL